MMVVGPVLIFCTWFQLIGGITCELNILVLSGSPGSHFFAMGDIAELLASYNFNVTMFGANADGRVSMIDRGFSFSSIENEAATSKRLLSWSNVFKQVILMPSSEDMMADVIVGSDEVQKLFIDLMNNLRSYFEGKEFDTFLRQGNFDVIVMDDYMFMMIAVKLQELNIPVIGINCLADMKGLRDKFGLPGLLNSEPNLTNNIIGHNEPSFMERWNILKRNFRIFSFIMKVISSSYLEDINQLNIDVADFFDLYDVSFLLDHPAFSFPYLAPPNTFYLGHFQLENRINKTLDPSLNVFIQSCPHEHIVYISFGSYVEDIFSVYPKLGILFKVFYNKEACFIVKAPSKIIDAFDLPKTKYYVRTWFSQRDLLGSGKITMFISHCGNNGRLESIFYNVPLLCIPLFADQYHNARLVDQKQFGTYLLKEDISYESIRQVVSKVLLNRDYYASSMKSATEIAKNDPGSGPEVLKFYIELLAKQGNARYLKNQIIKKQWFFEVTNLDFLLLALFFLTITIVLLLFVLFRCIKKIFQYLTRKLKKE